jgi:hypothetical protein
MMTDKRNYGKETRMMKRFFGGVIIALVVVLSSGAVYGQDKLTEEKVIGTVPVVWGNLRSAVLGEGSSTFKTTWQLFFEDSKGDIRVVTLVSQISGQTVISKLYTDPLIIKRSK